MTARLHANPFDTTRGGTASERINTTVLPNGVPVVSESVASVRSVALGFWINVGSRDEAPDEGGISHFIEHAVFKGTERRRTHHIAHYLESVGGYVNAFTGKDATCYYARVLDRHVPRAVDLLADLVIHPTFPEREIVKEKQVIAEEMRSIEDDPEDIINDFFEEQLFGRHPLGRPVIGTAESVNGLERETLRAFIHREYTAANLVIAAAGNVDHELLVALCEEALADLPAGTPRRRRPPSRRAPSHHSSVKSVQQAHYIAGLRVPGLRHSDSHALTMLNTLLGEGMGSRLFQRVRERHGVAYAVYSFLTLYEDAGVFGVYTSAEASAIDRCRDILRRELDLIATRPISPRELTRTREQAIGGMLIGLESMSTRMSRLGKDLLVYRRAIDIADVTRRLSAVTPDDILAVARYACDHGNYHSTMILPE